MTEKLETQIDRYIINTEERLLAVARTAIESTVDEAQTSKFKGGKMPIKTGFLRSTGIASLNRVPSGPDRGDKKQSYIWDEGFLITILAQLKLGDIFYFGWTAVYARKQEVYNGFLAGALSNWQKNVDAAVSKFRDRK